MPGAFRIGRRASLGLGAGMGAALAAGATARRAFAQETYPGRPVRIIVPFPPGQAADIFSRLLAEELSQRWPQRVFVENRAGGAGAIGMEAGARATPDGYTLVCGTSGTLGINPSVLTRLPYDAERDFAPITNIFMLPLVIVVHPDFPARTAQELVAYAKARPEGTDFASAGPATSQHMAAELFALRTGVKLNHVPYRGSGPAMADLLAGNVKLMFDSMASALPQIQAGRIRALAATTATRAVQLPDLPTVAETVAPGYAAMGWSGLVAPSGTPPEIVAKVNADSVAILREPRVVARMQELGGTADPQTPAQFAAFIRDEIAKWREVARAANVRLDG
ncbi:tripartite tricarboxylate transporter substrate binding protein [Roseomonas sp. NAR14]|uniref:Tripartite tricarboxylate transporter substrate binding protein n=1 Tax=Roseomonas acroporae TaxID=2937791 RepID=A0A9X1Y9Q1_9PROT|nr:tripartite tricarboxylate transporter substrate binding protein [Roseomonas acroporae]MCK8786724.1 tripartite tricarboxylate transporter substrate binding protein [Roseomonas acroporae]